MDAAAPEPKSTTVPATKPAPEFGLPLVNSRYHPKNYPFEYSKEEFTKVITESQQHFSMLSRSFRHFSYYPVIHPQSDIPAIIRKLIEIKFEDDFTLTACFDPLFIATLMYYGFLPIGDAYPHVSKTSEYQFQWLMPKLHKKRAVMDWSKFHIPSHLPKQSNGMFFTMNRDFDAVIAGCVGQHGDAWLYPRYRQVLKDMFSTNESRHSVKIISIEVWMTLEEIKKLTQEPQSADTSSKESESLPKEPQIGSDTPESTPLGTIQLPLQSKSKTTLRQEKFAQKQKQASQLGVSCMNRANDNPAEIPSLSSTYGPGYYLVAGEIGFTIDSTMYCSMTGFRNFYLDSTGTVQLYALGQLLRHAGVEVWDLGMIMEYKKAMGAVEVTRLHFTKYLNTLKTAYAAADPQCEATTVRFENVYNVLVDAQRAAVESAQRATNDHAAQIKKNQYEKKLRWLTKKFGADSEQVKDYVTFHESKSIITHVPQEETPLSDITDSSTIKTPRSPLVLIPCRTLLQLPSNVNDIDWVNRKPQPKASTLAKAAAAKK